MITEELQRLDDESNRRLVRVMFGPTGRLAHRFYRGSTKLSCRVRTYGRPPLTEAPRHVRSCPRCFPEVNQ